MRARPGGGAAQRRVRDNEAPAVGFAVEALLHRMTRHAVGATRADEIARADDFLSPALVEGRGHAIAIGRNRRRLDPELDLEPPPRQMVAQHALGAPLRLAALELIFAPHAREFAEGDALELRPKELDLLYSDAVGEKWREDAPLVQDLENCRLKARPARFVMRRRPSLDDPRSYAMTQKFARGEEPRRPCPDDEDFSIGRRAVSLCGLYWHSGFPQAFQDCTSRLCRFATKLRRANCRSWCTRSGENLVEPVEDRSIEERTVHHLAMVARALGGGKPDQLLRTLERIEQGLTRRWRWDRSPPP